ncbi:hypothetical protein NQ318_019205 [Aromia moschata]|uniref:Odorant receptor n=1 Tax=Aromia moschata TaxID=1265417 RepID=A0AAV8YSF2_9CUCU|nr:hypothetical protein NQ318_019205 [Aromia moschata]
MTKNNEYLTLCLRVIGISGLHPQKTVTLYTVVNIVLFACIFMLSTVKVITNFNLAQIEVMCYLFNVTQFIHDTWTRIGVVLAKKRAVYRLLDAVERFHTINFRSPENALYLMYFKTLRYYFTYQMLSLILLLIKPLIMGGSSTFDCYYPPRTPFLAVFLLESHSTIFMFLIYTATNILLCTLIILVVAQFQLVNGNIRTLDLERICDNTNLHICLGFLRKNIIYQNALFAYVEELKELMSMALFAQLLINILLICTSMYAISSTHTTLVDGIRSGVVTFSVLFETLFLYGLPSQLLTDQAEEMRNSIYCHTEWYLPGTESIRKYLLIMMMRCQRSVCISAQGFVDVNNRTIVFVKILHKKENGKDIYIYFRKNLEVIVMLATCNRIGVVLAKKNVVNRLLDAIERFHNIDYRSPGNALYLTYFKMLRYVEELKRLMSMALFAQLLINVLLICTSLYALSSTNITFIDGIRSGLISLSLLFETLFLYGLPSQLLTDQSEEIRNSIYCHTKWYLPGTESIRKYMLIMMMRCQKPVCISAQGFIDVNNRTIIFRLSLWIPSFDESIAGQLTRVVTKPCTCSHQAVCLSHLQTTRQQTTKSHLPWITRANSFHTYVLARRGAPSTVLKSCKSELDIIASEVTS